MDKAAQIEMLKSIIEAEREHLRVAVEQGYRTHAHQYVDSIIDRQRELEDLQK